MWSKQSEGEGPTYLQVKNTFLDFYSEGSKKAKSDTLPRSHSADSRSSRASQVGSARSGHSSGNVSTAGTTASSASRSRESSPPKETTTRANRCTNWTPNYSNVPVEQVPWEAEEYGAQWPSSWGPEIYAPEMFAPMQGYAAPQMVTMYPAQGYPAGMSSTLDSQASCWSPPAAIVQQSAPGRAAPKVVPARKHKTEEMPQNVPSVDGEEQRPVTTVMIRGIPCSVSADFLMSFLNEAGLAEQYDFFYLPRAGRSISNLGYAFVNFAEPSLVQVCISALDGVSLDPKKSPKICSISAADIQGLEDLRKHFRRAAVSRGNRGPIFLKVK